MFDKHGLASALIVVAGALGASAVYAGGGSEGAKAADDSAWSTSSHSDGSMTQTSQVEFNDLDADGDGYISEQELEDNDDVNLSQSDLDSDQDGQIDRSEFAAFELQEQSEMQRDSMGSEAGSMDGSGTSGSGMTEPSPTEGATSETETW